MGWLKDTVNCIAETSSNVSDFVEETAESVGGAVKETIGDAADIVGDIAETIKDKTKKEE